MSNISILRSDCTCIIISRVIKAAYSPNITEINGKHHNAIQHHCPFERSSPIFLLYSSQSMFH